VQAQTAGLVNNKQEMRNMVAQSFDLKTFLPEDIQNWESHYAEYLQATYNF
jgi:rhamnulokinase